jgi:uncharacterized protein (TIGR03118 family)
LPSAASTLYFQTNLTSDVPGLAANTDPNLKNPWGVSFGPTSPLWVSDQASGKSTLYTGTGASESLIVTVPPTSPPPAGPTGQVFNGTTSFALPGGSSHFIFDTLSGTIDAWGSSAGTTAAVMASSPGAVYTGLAIDSVGSNNYLYAANNAGGIDVYDGTFTNVSGTTFAGKFVDPNPVTGFSPFNIQNIGGNLYVEYAALNSMGFPMAGGYIDEFDSAGNFIKRVATGGSLQAPWGITLAPSTGFGTYSGDLLVGNFGNGQILAFDPTTDAYLGTLNGGNGQPLVNSFIWALDFGNGGPSFNSSALYFTAGINNQQDGLFASIQPIPEPAALGTTALALLLMVGAARRRLERTR